MSIEFVDWLKKNINVPDVGFGILCPVAVPEGNDMEQEERERMILEQEERERKALIEHLSAAREVLEIARQAVLTAQARVEKVLGALWQQEGCDEEESAP